MIENNGQMIAEFQKLMSTPEGKQLVSLLTNDGGTVLKSAGAALKAGDESAAKEKMAPLLQNSEVQKLLKSLEKTMGHG